MGFFLLPHSSSAPVVSFSALQDLQGEVESYFLTIVSARSSQILAFPREIISTVISDLWPSTTYLLSVQVSNGAHNTSKATVNVTTEDGGMCTVYLCNIQSTIVFRSWLKFAFLLPICVRVLLCKYCYVCMSVSCTVHKFNTSKRGVFVNVRFSASLCFTRDVKHIM